VVLLFDVNVVLAAHRGDHAGHEVARAELLGAGAGEQPFAVPSGVWSAVLRLATNRRIFPVPSSVADVFAFIDAVVSQPTFVWAEPGPRHLDLLRRACEESGSFANLIPDAVLAALAVEHGATVVSFDRDFDRFAVAHRRPGRAGGDR